MDYHPDLEVQPETVSPNLQCIKEIIGIYHSNFFYFGAAFLPPVLFAYLIHAGGDSLTISTLHGHSFRGGSLSLATAAQAAVFRYGGYALAAVIFGLVSGGVASAVRQIRAGAQRPPFEAALRESKARALPIAISSIVDLFGSFFGVVICVVLSMSMVLKFGVSSKYALWLGWGMMAFYLAVFSRWMLSIPVLMEEGCGVMKSFVRSQQLAQNFTPALVLLTAHAVIAGYFAAKIPYYLFGFAARHLELPGWSGWIPFVLSFVFVAWTEPVFFIGCAEVYFSARENELSPQGQGGEYGLQ
jgi:hypothetical protein